MLKFCDRLLQAASVALLTGSVLISSGEGQASAAPLSVGKDCVLRLNGRPYRGIGVNYFTAFTRVLANPNDGAVRAQLHRLHEAGIPFIRFPVLPYWPKDAKPFMDDPERLYAAMDKFVAMAEAENIGLIPSVFFNFRTVADAFGEPLSAWADPSSRTATFAKDFTTRLAQRYHGSEAIWAWELSNETNDWSDFSRAFRYFEVNAKQGTPQARSPADNYSSQQMLSVFKGFSDTLRAADPGRLVESGYNLPRNNAFHLAHGSTQQDSVEDFGKILARDNGPGNLASIHVYPKNLTDNYSVRFADKPVDAAGFIQVAAEAAQQACRPLFIGEFGVPDSGGPTDGGFDGFHRLVDAISASPAPLAAAWVFDYPLQDDFLNMTFNNQRRDRLTLIGQVNQSFAASPRQ